MSQIDVNCRVACRGFYKLLVTDTISGKVKHDTGWFENLITNQGLDWIGANSPQANNAVINICTHCAVGTGNTTPAYTDTHLTSFLAQFPTFNTDNVTGFSSYSYVPGPPAYWSGIFVYSFATGAVVGNIAEVGVGNVISTDTSTQLFSHALIVDGSGNPTTISVLATDALTVNYELRMYLDLTDNTYSLSISGVTYSGTYRRSVVGTVPRYYYQVDYYPGGSIGYTAVYNGTIGTVLQTPTGTSSNAPGNGTTTPAYIPGTYYISYSVTIPTTSGNLSGGITALTATTNHGSWQFSVSPAIPKDSTKTLTLNFNVSWSRYP